MSKDTLEEIELEGVREYAEHYPVKLVYHDESEYVHDENHPSARKVLKGDPRWKILARNEGGYNTTWVDLEDLLNWLRAYRPELLELGK